VISIFDATFYQLRVQPILWSNSTTAVFKTPIAVDASQPVARWRRVRELDCDCRSRQTPSRCAIVVVQVVHRHTASVTKANIIMVGLPANKHAPCPWLRSFGWWLASCLRADESEISAAREARKRLHLVSRLIRRDSSSLDFAF